MGPNGSFVSSRHIAAVVAGNALEFYDFLTYAIFAVYIAKAYFPSSTPGSSLLLTLATFGAGFVTRPVGAVVLGFFGDRAGRRRAMYISFLMMGTAMAGVALTPSYATIGVVSPILVLGFRLLQGFALGGQVGPATAFLIEAAGPAQRGLFGSLQASSQFLSTFTAGVVGSLLAALLSPEALSSWGWRLAFLLGALIVPFGFFIRKNLPETMHHADDAALAPDATDGSTVPPPSLSSHLRIAVLGLMMLGSATITTYVILFLPTYAIATLHMSAQSTFGATLVAGGCGAVFSLLGGALSDRVGRKPVMLGTGIAILFIAVPLFTLLDQTRTAVVLLGVAALLTGTFTFGSSVLIMSITEALPPRIRAGATSTIYALAITIFGGTTQYNVAWLIQHTGNTVAPAWYMSGAMVVGLIAMMLMHETAPARLGSPSSAAAARSGRV